MRFQPLDKRSPTLSSARPSFRLSRRGGLNRFEFAQTETGSFYRLFGRDLIERCAVLHGDGHGAVLDIGFEALDAIYLAELLFQAIGTKRAGQAVHMQPVGDRRSEEHTSELQSLMRNSYAVFCLKKKK